MKCQGPNDEPWDWNTIMVCGVVVFIFLMSGLILEFMVAS